MDWIDNQLFNPTVSNNDKNIINCTPKVSVLTCGDNQCLQHVMSQFDSAVNLVTVMYSDGLFHTESICVSVCVCSFWTQTDSFTVQPLKIRFRMPTFRFTL